MYALAHLNSGYLWSGMVDLLQMLERFGRLTDGERRLVEDVNPTVKQIEGDCDLMREGDRPSRFVMFLDGLACRYKTMEDGRRQILAFHMAGDLCDVAGLHLKQLDSTTRTLTSAKVVFIPHGTVVSWSKFQPRLSEFLWRTVMVDAAISREWIVNVGRRTAYQRTGHLLCEIVSRLQGALGASGPCYDLPLTQSELADALSLTAIHVGRMLQQLRADGFVELSRNSLTMLNWRGLKQMSNFDPGYLQEFGEASGSEYLSRTSEKLGKFSKYGA
ncbi:MAG: Crp/Fnr family transcriptional regulator [Janthinobacterium lividum]